VGWRVSAPQKTATEWLHYLVAHVESHGKFPLVSMDFGDAELDLKLAPWRLVSVDIQGGTCTTAPADIRIRYIGPTTELRIYTPPAQEPA
jgi:hypothetical protein